jgi:hypothetical protein
LRGRREGEDRRREDEEEGEDIYKKMKKIHQKKI